MAACVGVLGRRKKVERLRRNHEKHPSGTEGGRSTCLTLLLLRLFGQSVSRWPPTTLINGLIFKTFRATEKADLRKLDLL